MSKDDKKNPAQTVLAVAQKIFDKNHDWATFHQEILGVEGAARRIFTTSDEMRSFETTKEFAEILLMLAKLRARPGELDEKPSVVTVRFPKSMHKSLVAEAHERETSMNKLCIAKLLQGVDQKFINPNREKE